MTHTDPTESSPLDSATQSSPPLLCFTILWHPDHGRVGQQFIATDSSTELSRFAPLFQAPGAAGGLPLGEGKVSREALRITRLAGDEIRIEPPASKMVVELNGKEIAGAMLLQPAHIRAGAVLGLGRTVLLCLHFMQTLPVANLTGDFIGVGQAAIETRELIAQVARTDATVLLLGETGSGKEVAAQAIHRLSQRAATPMVAVNMAALNEALAPADLFGAVRGAYTGAQTSRNGWFAEADTSTLFLDEIGNAPASVQAMLLRVLETGQYRPLGAQRDQHSHARLIAATDQNLYDNSFNQALLRRLEGFVLNLRPLRERREDMGVLVLHLLASIAPAAHGVPALLTGQVQPQVGFSTQLISEFANYDWPGNVRQLRHVVKRALLLLQLGKSPRLADLVDLSKSQANDVLASVASVVPVAEPVSAATTVPSARKKLTELSEQDVLDALEHNAWYIQGAAQDLGISRPSMYKLLESHPQIRRVEQIEAQEIRQALDLAKGDLEACASTLKTPAEALRRHLRVLGLESS